MVTTRGMQTHFSVRFYLISTLPGWIWFLPLWYSLKYFLKNAFIWRQQTCLSSEDSCNSFFGSIVDGTKTKPICVCLCVFRKQKRNWLNQRSTKRLEAYWTQWSLKDDFWCISVLTVRFTCLNVHSFRQALFGTVEANWIHSKSLFLM